MVRFAREEDIESINVYLSHYNVHLTKEEFNAHPFAKYLIVLFENKIAGFLSYQKIYERYEIDYLYVDEKYRNKGCATELIEFLISKVEENKGTNITLEVSKSNRAALSLYQKYGFEYSACREKYYGSTDGYLLIRKM